jgi:hypothetical protein
MQEGASPVAAEPTEEEKKKEEKTKMTLVVKALSGVAKELVTTPSDGPTGSDDAEEQIMDVLTDVTEDNLQEVTKNLTNILQKQKVQKSIPAEPAANNSMILKAINSMANVIKAHQERQAVIEKAVGGILEGMGIADAIEVVNKSQADTQDPAPVSPDNLVNKSGQPNLGTQNQDVIAYLQQMANVNKSDGTAAGVYGAHVDRQNSIKKTLSDENFINGLIGRRA